MKVPARRLSPWALGISGLLVLGVMQGATATTHSTNGISSVSTSGLRATSMSYATTTAESTHVAGVLAAARDFIERHAQQWQITPSQLRFDRIVPTGDGQHVVRFKQYVGDVEIFASLVAVTLDKDNALLAVTVEVAPVSALAAPTFTASQAERAIHVATQSTAPTPTSEVRITNVEPLLVDSHLSPEMPNGQYFVWRANTYVHNSQLAGMKTYIADGSGALLWQVPLADSVANNNNVSPDPLVCDMQQAVITDYLGQSGNGGILGTTRTFSTFSSAYVDSTHIDVTLGIGSAHNIADGSAVSVSGIGYPYDGVFTASVPNNSSRALTYRITVPDATPGSDNIPSYVYPGTILVSQFGGSTRYMNTDSSAYPLCGKNFVGEGVASTLVAKQNIINTSQFFNTILATNINCVEYLGNISALINQTSDNSPGAKCGYGNTLTGAVISAYVNVCTGATNSTCPLQNAFWVPWSSAACGPSDNGSCSGIFMGQGFDGAQDVIAHELAHGVSFAVAFNTSGSANSETSGISEGLSDVFGEAVDQLYVTSGEAADYNWNIGEGVSSDYVRGFRNMREVLDSTQGGAIGSDCAESDWVPIPKINANWDPTCDSHAMNGPLDRFAWILANGDTASGVTAMGTHPSLCTSGAASCTGIVRMSKLVYKAMASGMTASSTYWDFARAVSTACNSLVTSKVQGFTAATCLNVGKALRVTGISGITLSGATVVRSASHSVGKNFSATLTTLTSRPAKSIPATLQYYNSATRKWVVAKSTTSTSSGLVQFSSIKLPKVATKYRIAVNALNGGAVAASGTYSITVR